jgi:hypothetical protein
LEIENLKDLHLVTAPPTEDELLDFDSRNVGCIHVSAEPGNFRLDYSNSPHSNFNQEAIDVFSEDFRQKVSQSDWYRDNVNDRPIDREFLSTPSIVSAAQSHFIHIKGRYNMEVLNVVPGQKAMVQQADARSVRKTRVRIFLSDSITTV